MKLNTWTSAERGRSLHLANALGVSAPTVSDWSTGKKAIPVERCVAIERATNGEVTRQDMRPDDWRDIWPELDPTTAPIAPAASESAPAVQAGALRTGTVRRHIARRVNDVPVDADRRHAGPPFYSIESGEA